MSTNANGVTSAIESFPRKQQIALAQLLLGKNVTEAAKAAKVDRTTVHRWLKTDFEFQAAFNRGRQELQDALQARLLQLAERAIETIEEAVAEGDVRAALAVLKGLGLLDGRPLPLNSDDPADLEREWEIENMRKAREYQMEVLISMPI